MVMQQLGRNMGKRLGAMRAFSGLTAKAAGGGTAAYLRAVAQRVELPGGGRMVLWAKLKKMSVDPDRKFHQEKIGATMVIQHLGQYMARNFAATRAFSAFAAKSAGGGIATPSRAVHQLARGGGKARVPSTPRHFSTGDPGGLSPDDEAILKAGMGVLTVSCVTNSVLLTFASICNLTGINPRELVGFAFNKDED